MYPGLRGEHGVSRNGNVRNLQFGRRTLDVLSETLGSVLL
jgi:hypothetical protein